LANFFCDTATMREAPLDQQERQIRQYAALPTAEMDGEIMVLLVTSRDTGRWVLPKGWAEKGLSGAELAAKEAFEEAGLLGMMRPKRIGRFSYGKRLPQDRIAECRVDVFHMLVEQLLDDWPERGQRTRRWFTLSQAAMAVDDNELALLLLELAQPA
jgi:8-oxo-dGTP pyrophosphatase MutT (NUDIX family)